MNRLRLYAVEVATGRTRQLTVLPSHRARMSDEQLLRAHGLDPERWELAEQPRPQSDNDSPDVSTWALGTTRPLAEMPDLHGKRCALFHCGGFGDTDDAAVIGAAIRATVKPSVLALYVERDYMTAYAERLTYNGAPVFDFTLNLKRLADGWPEAVERERANWDVLFDWRPYVGQVYVKGEPLYRAMPGLWRQVYNRFLSPAINEAFGTSARNVWEIGFESMGLEPVDTRKVVYQLPVHVRPEIQEAASRPFITINNGSDSGTGERRPQVKEWDVEKWAEVVRALRQRYPHLAVYHIGAASEPPIPLTQSLVGMTSVPEVMWLLSRSILHFAPENGTVRMAHRVGTRSIVVYGPTSVGLYQLPGNIAVKSDACTPCFWRHHTWAHNCVNGWDAICLRMVRPDQVLAAAYPILNNYVEELVDGVR